MATKKIRTEAEWLGCTNPTPMIETLRRKGSDRKLRLFACACIRRIWHLLKDQRSREVVLLAERFADGLATKEQLHRAYRASEQANYDALCAW